MVQIHKFHTFSFNVLNFFPVPVHSVTVTVSTIDIRSNRTGSRSVRLVENHPKGIRCLAVGGYPPPKLDIFAGTRELTSEFLYRNGVTMTGKKGFRLVTYTVERWTYGFRPKADDDQARLKCVATVRGLKPVTDHVILDVDCELKTSYLTPRGVGWKYIKTISRFLESPGLVKILGHHNYTIRESVFHLTLVNFIFKMWTAGVFGYQSELTTSALCQFLLALE